MISKQKREIIRVLNELKIKINGWIENSEKNNAYDEIHCYEQVLNLIESMSSREQKYEQENFNYTGYQPIASTPTIRPTRGSNIRKSYNKPTIEI